MNTVEKHSKITSIIKENEDEIKRILSSPDLDIANKRVLLRMLGRKIADSLAREFSYKSLEEFYQSYDDGESPLTRLEGEGVRYDNIIILKECPMSPLFSDFKEGDDFPDYWKRVPKEFMEHFKNEAILHPLCIVHQTFRDELAAKIQKGNSFVHSTAVACRSTLSGMTVYSTFGIEVSGRTKREIDELIAGKACAFRVK